MFCTQNLQWFVPWNLSSLRSWWMRLTHWTWSSWFLFIPKYIVLSTHTQYLPQLFWYVPDSRDLLSWLLLLWIPSPEVGDVWHIFDFQLSVFTPSKICLSIFLSYDAYSPSYSEISCCQGLFICFNYWIVNSQRAGLYLFTIWRVQYSVLWNNIWIFLLLHIKSELWLLCI